MSPTSPRHVVMLSGGKDSTALALYLRDRHPDRTFEYVFCDTHKELPETYEYLSRIEAYLGQPIERLSSHHGERGFDHYLKLYGDFLPSPKQRWCTRRLKIEPFERHVGDDPSRLYVGLRADERRSGYISTKENIRAVFPFKEDGIDKAAVMRILDESGVGLPSYYEWRSRSGCYFCFFQQRRMGAATRASSGSLRSRQALREGRAGLHLGTGRELDRSREDRATRREPAAGARAAGATRRPPAATQSRPGIRFLGAR